MKGREASAWQKALVAKPWPEALKEIEASGFSGIYLDRRAFADQSTEPSLRSLLGTPIVSDDGHLVFFAVK